MDDDLRVIIEIVVEGKKEKESQNIVILWNYKLLLCHVEVKNEGDWLLIVDSKGKLKEEDKYKLFDNLINFWHKDSTIIYFLIDNSITDSFTYVLTVDHYVLPISAFFSHISYQALI